MSMNTLILYATFAFLIMNTFGILPCKGYPVYSYDFNVFPVAECPMNSSTFQLASKRMNCTKDSRYLCSPDSKLQSLIEFCTDRPRKLYGPDSCVRLEGAGDLNHVKCVEKFTKGCPNTSYYDNEIYKFPECLHIDPIYNCFTAEKNCSRIHHNVSQGKKMIDIVWKITISVGVFLTSVIVLLIMLLYWRKVKNKKENKEIDMAELRKFLGKKYVNVCHARCIIVGCAKAGKTTLLKRLQDKPYKEVKNVKETYGIDVHINSFEVLENTIKGVKKSQEMPNIPISAVDVLDKGDGEEVLSCDEKPHEQVFSEANESKKLLSYEEDAACQSVDVKDDCLTNEEDTSTKENKCMDFEDKNFNEMERISQSKEKVIDTDIESYAMSKILDAVHRLGGESVKKPRLTFLDFAGQNAYYAFHQIYLSPKTLYILVVDMSKKFTDDNEEDCKGVSRFTSWKYEDYYKFWLKSIDSFSDTRTPVIVVGTHAEDKTYVECQRFFEEFYALFKGREDLQRHLHTDRFFSIKFPKDGSKLEAVNDIKKCISKLVQVYLKDRMRSAWAIFEYIVQREKVQRKIIHKDKLLEYNTSLHSDLRMTEEEITNMLLFLHRVGAVLYIDEEDLRNTIILDVQWFVDAFKYIITDSVDVQEATNKNRQHFYETGELKDDELEEIWKKYYEDHKELFNHKEEILLYMEQLGLLAKCTSDNSTLSGKNDWYYFPSMNKRKFDKDAMKKHRTSSILCFQFDEEGRLPIFLFYELVLKCFKLPGWAFLKDGDERCIYEYAACFDFDKHIIVLCICKFQIQVQVGVPTNNKISTAVLKKVQKSIEEKIREFKKYTYRVGYKCENGVLFDEKDNSFIEQRSLRADKVFCEKCSVSKKHFVDSNVSWIKMWKMENSNKQYYTPRKEETDEGLTSFSNILVACLEGNIENFNFHLHKEINERTHLLMRSDINGWNLLHFAAKGGNLKIFQELVSKNLNIFQRTNDQMTVLHIAAQNRNLDICTAIVDTDEFSELLNAKSQDGKNACHYAAEGGSIDILGLLVARNIDMKATTNNGQNIFHIACIYDKLEMCQYIANNCNELIFAEDKEKWNATLYTAKQGHVDILRFLKERGVSFEHKSESDRNALHIACDNGHLEASTFIIEKCPSLCNAVDQKGRHAGHFAARSGNVEIMKLLVNKGEEVTRNTKTKMNILHMACLHCRKEMCEFILATFPALNSEVTSRGWTTAHFVAGRGKNDGHEIEIFEMITGREDGLDIQRLTNKNNSVLTLAIKNNMHEFCEYLFQNFPSLLDIPMATDPMEIENKDSKMIQIVKRYKK